MRLIVLCLGLVLVHAETAVAQINEDSTAAELISGLSKAEVEQRRDAAYELVRRQDVSPAVVSALAKAVSDDDTQVRFQALLGLARAGEKALPATDALLGCLDDRDDQVRYRAADALGKIGVASVKPLIAAWSRGSDRTKTEIARALAIVGPDASAAVPLLSEALANGSSELKRYAAQALVAISPQSEAALLEIAQLSDATARSVGVSALAALASPSATVTEVFRKATADPDPRVRETAIIALAKSHLPSADKAEFVERALRDDTDSVCAAAVVAMCKADLCTEGFAETLASRLSDTRGPEASPLLRALATIGFPARATLPKLIEAAKQPDADQRLIAQAIASFGEAVVPDLLNSLETEPKIEPTVSTALAMIGAPAKNALLAGLSSPSQITRVAATRALGQMSLRDRAQLESLASALVDPSPAVRKLAVIALTAAGEDASFAKESVLDAMEDSDPDVRAAALMALPTYDYSAEQVEASVERGLADSSPAVRVRTLETLANLPTAQKPAVEQVLALASDAEADVRRAAIGAVSQSTKEAVTESVAQTIADALADPDNSVRVAATQAVIALELANEKVLEALGNNLVDDVELLRVTLDAIGGLDEKASPLIPTVANLLGHQQAAVRTAAIGALAAIDKDPVELTNRLTIALDDSEWDVRRSAAQALGKLGPNAKQAIPKLFRMLASEEDSDTAGSTIREIDAAPVEALSLFKDSLKSEDRRTAYYSIFLLGKIGPAAGEVLPELEAMLEADSGDRRSEFRNRYLKQAIAAIKGEEPPEDR